MWIKKLNKNLTNSKPNKFQNFSDNLQNEAESSTDIYIKEDKSQLTFKERKYTIHFFIRTNFIKTRRLKLVKKIKKKNTKNTLKLGRNKKLR